MPKLYLDVKLVTIPFDRAYPHLLGRSYASKPLSALFSLRWPSEAVRGWGHMPCATTHPCSEELVAVLPCPPRPRGILGKYSSPLPGSCGPIPQGGGSPAVAAEASSMEKMMSMRSRFFTFV